MADISTLVRQIKQAAIDAVNENCPCEVIFGVVKSEQPLEINVEQKLTLTEKQLLLTRNVTEHTLWVTGGNVRDVSFLGEYPNVTEIPLSSPHVHALGKMQIVVHNALKTGERVAMVRVQGGQKFLVLDRVGDA